MKTHSDELFLLIKAMSPKEKLFLKISSRKNPNDHNYSYLTLFDILNEMKQYDERALRTKLAKQGYQHNLNKAKNYLTKAILKSLAEYHSESSVDTVLENQIFHAEILYKKRLDAMADKILRKAEKLALEYEKHEYLLMISSLKLNMALEISDLGKLKEFINTGITKEKAYIKHFLNSIDYRNLAIEITILNQSPDVVSGDKAKNHKLKQLFEHPLLENSKSALTFSAKKFFYQLNYIRHYRYSLEGNKKSHGMLEEWVEYLENKKKLLQNFPEVYIKALSRQLVAFGKLSKKEEVDSAFEKAKDFYGSIPRKNMNKNIHQSFAHLMINYSYAQMLFLAPEKTVKEFENLNNLVRIELDVTAHFNLFWAYFYLENYHEAILCLNKILDAKGEFRKDLQAMARVYLLMLHYDLKNMDMFPYTAKSSERWLIKNKYTPKDAIKQLIDFFIYKLPKIITREDEIKEFSILLTAIKRVEPDETIISWVKSKIQNRPMLDVYREMMNSR